MINASHFQKALPEFEGRGQTVDQYMVGAYYWLGWGIKGYRQQYAYDYTKKMFWACLLYTSPSPRDRQKSRMPSSA